MPDKVCDDNQFLADVASHSMSVKLDDGLYRNVVFRAADKSWNHWFEIVTWPGCLVIHGDMGTWTFSRVDDMFRFFRDSEGLKINPHYWCEKLRAGTGSEGMDLAKNFDADEFRKRCFERISDCFSDEPDKVVEITDALKDDLYYEEFEWDLKRAVYNFKHKDYQFDGCDMPDGKVWSYHYLWCCYAIVWAIQQYDAAKSSTMRELESGK